MAAVNISGLKTKLFVDVSINTGSPPPTMVTGIYNGKMGVGNRTLSPTLSSDVNTVYIASVAPTVTIISFSA